VNAQTTAGLLRVTVAQPVTLCGDVAANVTEHVRLINAAGQGLVVFPELSLTGYTLDARAVSDDDDRLLLLVAACRGAAAVALVGAPVPSGEGGARSIGIYRVDGDGVSLAYKKVHLGGAEPLHYEPGVDENPLLLGNVRVAVGVCRDTGQAAHIQHVAGQRPDIYAAGLVHSPHEVLELERRAQAIAVASGAWVAFASAAGPASADWPSGAPGRSGVWSPDGVRRVDAGSRPGAAVTWAIPLS